MPRKESKTDTKTALPFEEWDFSPLSKDDPNLRTIIEYEYLRSSPLREKIIEWQARSCAETAFARPPFIHIAVVRAARLITVSDRSPLGRLQVLFEEANRGSRPPLTEKELLRNGAQMDAVMPRAAEQMTKLKWDVTIREAIRRIFKVRTVNPAKPGHISDIKIYNALKGLEDDVPDDLKKLHAERICTRFDQFPEPWLKVLNRGGAEDLKRRCNLTGLEHPAVMEIPAENSGKYFPPNRPWLRPGTQVHAFSVDWLQDPEEIGAAFARWVNARHSAAKAGARHLPEWLTRLAIYRLRRVGKLKVKDAQVAIAERKQGRTDTHIEFTDPGSPQSWSNQLKRVEDELKGDFIEELRDGLLPSECLMAKVVSRTVRIGSRQAG